MGAGTSVYSQGNTTSSINGSYMIMEGSFAGASILATHLESEHAIVGQLILVGILEYLT
jgi:hypothetical protein